jgi:cytochrome c-type biogenesis protein CcmH/NrfG
VTGTQVRISAYLRRESDGLTVWTETFDRTIQDARVVQDEVAYRIAKAIDAKLKDDSPISRGTANAEAWALYQQAVPLDRERAEPLLQRALGLDPTFAKARVMLAEKLLNEVLEGDDRQPNNPDRATQARIRIEAELRSALATSPQLVAAHLLKSRVDGELSKDKSAAFDGMRRALLIDPLDWSAHAHAARLFMEDAQMDDALNELKQAAELSPTAIERRWIYAVILRWAGQVPEALEQIERAISVDPGDATYQVEHARILFDLGRHNEAESIVLRLSHTWGYRTIFILGRTGHRVELEALIRNPKVSAEDRAYAQLMLGDSKPMLAELSRAEGRPLGVNYKLWDSSFDVLRDTPEFKAWLDRHQLAAVHQRAQEWRASRLRADPPKAPASATQGRKT